MEILDAQLHCWLADRAPRPWIEGYRERTRRSAPLVLLQTAVPMAPATLLAEMDAAGVAAGVLTPQGVYGNDNGFELEARAAAPDRFAVMGWVDHRRPDVADALAADRARGMAGARLLGFGERALARGDVDAALAACAALRLPVALWLPHPVPPALVAAIERHPELPFLVDHLGVGHAPPALGWAPEDPWEHLPGVLALARHPNTYIKLTGAPALSHEPYPFRDIWPGLLRIVEAFGPERVLWGSDITRTGSLHTYADAVGYLTEVDGLGPAELAELYGRALRRVLDWPAPESTDGGSET
jgi:L-fuconolactonase